ncbi:hypothetical protein NXF52_25490 [Klebsiella pneumoniae]|uniref:hypothetical protein n=1 Tax=Klebsiella pneumoniae TaxID=573 RepID=UPI00287C0415|nr:hypothetical protein [Klebsiella pneumoniae]MDS6815001.1 hypothetical protein [Klebsiella pneumoniae]MDS6875435.1 hypothetical protein [Klebsiella pneumoniae]MDS6880987.1 hypothetical protein [Klebsiella pneumoniae]MDS6886320.1 hypothetical protein [Klebsiella pneumoniae]
MDLSNLDPQDANFVGQSGFTEATRADYQPGLLDGSGEALMSGIESGASIATQSGLKGVIASNMQQFTMLHPEESEAIQKPVNQAIDTSFTSFRKGIAPDAETTGKAGQILFGLGQYFPALAGAVVNPVLGAGVAQQISQTATTEELTGKGVSQQDAEDIALPKSFVDAAGFLLPAAVGGRLVTRIASGASINMAAGAASREVTNLMLQDKNYSAVAEQYKAWDGEAMVVDGILGAAFGGIHHLTSRGDSIGRGSDTPAPMTPDEIRTVFGDNYQPSPDGSTETLVRDLADSGVIKLFDEPAVDNGDGTQSLRGGFVREAPGEPTTLNINLNRLESHEELADILHHEALHLEQRSYPDWKARKLANAVFKAALARPDTPEYAHGIENFERYSREGNFDNENVSYPYEWVRNEEVAAHAVEPSVKSEIPKWSELASQLKGYVFRYSGVQLGRVTPEQLRTLVALRLNGMQMEAAVQRTFGDIIPGQAFRELRKSDIDQALAMNEVHNHDIAASPVLHGTPESMDAHYRAMGDAAVSIARGDPVDVSAHADSFDGHIRPEAFNDGARPEMESALHENDIGTAAPVRTRQPQPFTEEGEAQFAQFLGDEGSVDPDTGVNLGNSYELATASRLAEEIPDLTVEHPDTGQQVKLSDLMDEYNDKIATSQDSANVFPFVASCMLRNPE